MAILIGMGWLISMCSLIIVSSSIAISKYTQEEIKKDRNDPYAYLFDIYNDC